MKANSLKVLIANFTQAIEFGFFGNEKGKWGSSFQFADPLLVKFLDRTLVPIRACELCSVFLILAPNSNLSNCVNSHRQTLRAPIRNQMVAANHRRPRLVTLEYEGSYANFFPLDPLLIKVQSRDFHTMAKHSC